MNATLHKFGYPGTLLHEYRHWCVLLRPAQVTLGALVLAAKSEATSFAALPPEAQIRTAAINEEYKYVLTKGGSPFRGHQLGWMSSSAFFPPGTTSVANF